MCMLNPPRAALRSAGSGDPGPLNAGSAAQGWHAPSAPASADCPVAAAYLAGAPSGSGASHTCGLEESSVERGGRNGTSRAGRVRRIRGNEASPP